MFKLKIVFDELDETGKDGVCYPDKLLVKKYCHRMLHQITRL